MRSIQFSIELFLFFKEIAKLIKKNLQGAALPLRSKGRSIRAVEKMKNWMSIFLILCGSLFVFFELPAQFSTAFYETLDRESSFFKVYVTYDAEEERAEYAFSFKQEKELDEKFSMLEEDLFQALILKAQPYTISGVFLTSGSNEEMITVVEEMWDQVLVSLPIFYDENSPSRRRDIASAFPVMRGWGDSKDTGLEPKTEEAKPFFDLPLSNEDKKNIRTLIVTLADKNILQLLIDKKSMNKLGDKIRAVHPLKFAAFILGDPYLKKCLMTIEKDSLKWNPFVEGFEEKMKTEAKAGRVLQYIPGFVEFLDADLKQVQKLIQSKDYAGILSAL